MTHDVQAIWGRIEKVLCEHAPESAKTLAEPATEDEIRELEECIALRLPESFKRSLMLHNGQNDPTSLHSFCGSCILLSTKEVAATWKMLTELDERFRRLEPDWDKPYFGHWWNRNWIPFADCSGDAYCISLDPRLGDRVGEIVEFVHDNPHTQGIAPSFGDWLERVAAQLERGEFTVREGGWLWLNLL